MNRHTHTSGKIILTIVAILMQVLCLNGIAQNINNPNKTGPMGLQVNTYTGNLFFSRTDVVIPSRGFSLVIGFSYNSFNFNQAGPFGNGWSINYDIKYLSDPEGNKTIVWGDGREDYYVKSGNNYTTPTGFYTQLEEYQPGRLRLTQRDGTEYYFDNATHRRITGMKEPNGNQQSFTYADTLLTGITSPSGQTLSLAYNSNGSLSTLTDANNNPIRTWTYQYDAAGNLVKVIDPLTNEYRYGYLVNGPIKEVRDRNGNVVNIIYYNNYAVSEMIGCNQRISITYDEATLTTVATDHMENGEDQATKYMYKKINDNIWLAGIQGNCCGFKMDFEYDDAGNKIKEVDANGNNTRYTYDEKGNVLTVTDALNHVYSFTYTSDFNFLKSTTDPKGFTSEMTYDARGNLLQIKDAGNRIFTATYADNGDILTSTDPKGNVYNYTYDVFGNPIEVTGPHGYRATMAYDARGRLLSYTDSRNQLSVAEYDILNRLQKITDPLNQSYNMKYDANGNLIKVINPASETLKISYDASDRPVILEDAIGQSTTLKYDEQNNLTNFQNVINQTIQLKYDKQNRLKKATNNAGEHSAFEYDNNGNLTMVILPNGRQLSFVYDKLDRLVKLEDADGTVGEMTYDENNNISSYKNGTGALITATFDALKRPIKINDPLGNSVLLEYDENGKISRIIDLNGNSTSYEYDGRNRPIKITDQLGSTIQIAYDLNNNMSSLTDQKGNVTSYQYDELNRLTRTTYSDGKFMEYGYDQKNNLIIAKVTDGGNIHYNYDSLNRMIAKTLPDGNTYTYTYDGLSRVLTATNAAGTVSFGYDQLNRLTSETYKGRTVLYTYDTEGRKQTITYPDGTEVTMQYDKRNRLTNVMENGSPVANYTYNGFDQQTSRILANGIGSYYQYDIANRLVGYSTANKQQVRIKYDKLGNKTEVQRLHAPQLSERFVYDANNRLTGYQRGLISSPDMQQSYNYDALGNRISATINGVLTTSINNNLNQLIQLQSGANNRTLLYDENGNLRFDGKFYKTYDAEKRLLKDSASPAAVYTYLYDALGRRISKTINGQLFEYSFAGMLPIEERTGAHQRSKQIFGGFLTPLSIEYNNQRYYYEQNEQGSVESISNSNGQLIERYEYDPYGKQHRFDSVGNALAGSLVANRLGFTGQEFDSATATNAFFFRNYNPELGVFQQRDLIGYGDGMGLYQYVHNNPANGVDILGLRDCNENPTSNPNLETLAEIETDLSWINAISSSYEMKVANQFGDLKKLTSDLNVLNKEIQQVNKNLNELASLAKQHKALVDASMNIALKHNNIKTALSLISKAGHIAEGHGGIQGIQKAINAGGSKLGSLKQTASGMANAQGKLKFLKGLGTKLNVLDVSMKGAKLLNTFSDGKSQMTDQGMAAADLVQSATAFTPPGALYNLIDFAQSKLTGKSINQHISDESNLLFDDYYQKQADQADQEYIEYLKSVGKFEDYLNARKKVKNRVRNPNCPQNGSNGGTRRPSPYPRDSQSGTVQILGSYDPNEIVGPVGQPDKRWVSVKDRLPYTINFENDTIATAPAKAVRITAPIHPKMDASTLELGSFGFNSLSFNIPSGTSAYYQRLDCRDSLGIFVDITAGFDVVNNQVFWLLQSIDPVSLQTPSDPLKGLLLLQDTANPTYGHGFANFIIKPQQSAVTLDSILADAVIIFDENDPIPTNVERNTIDAFAPNSQLSTLPATSPVDIHLNWSGQDDPDGCGIRFYTLYASTDGVNFNIVRTNITRTDTVITGQSGLTYHFFVLATDSVGNTEKLLPGAIQSTFVGAPLPATWLSFTGTNQGTDNLLRWATANERNVKAFQLERSLDATSFKTITKQKPNGGLGRQGNYQHLDERVDRLKTDALYYRVKMVDNDGSSNYSSIIKIAIRQEIITKTVVYPNPTRSQITIAVGSEELVGTSAVILDNRGRAIKQIILSSNNHVLNLDSLPAGMYYIRLKNGEVLKVIKQ